MNKQNSLPDFKQLCPPEQTHTKQLLSLEILFFFFCAIIGFLWEVLLMYLCGFHYVNRGFFYGPWLPIYGIGGVLFHLLLAPKAYSDTLSKSSCRSTNKASFLSRIFLHIPAVFLFSALLGSGIELFIGWFLDSLWQLRYWDYSNTQFHFHGYICLWSAIGFGCAGVLWISLLSPCLMRLWFRLPEKWRRGLNTILLLLFVFDCAAALIFPNAGKGITFP